MKIRLRISFVSLCLGICAVLAFGIAAAYSATSNSGKTVDWPVYGGELASDHYSALAQINRQNVGDLRRAWVFDTGEKGALQTSPLVIGHVLFAYTATQKVIALDAASGKLLWKFDSGIVGTGPMRGLAYWTNGKQSRLFAGVMNFLYALDPSTGKPISSFAENGRIDLRKGLGPRLSPGIARDHNSRRRLQKSNHHGRHGAGDASRTAWRYPRFRCSHRSFGVEIPYHSASRRIWIRYLAEGCVEDCRLRKQLGRHDSGYPTRHCLCANRIRSIRLLRRRSHRQ